MTKSNHLCVRCQRECDCPGLHMLSDCESCSRCGAHCPVCGYYCLGKGGMGCIDKPAMIEKT